MSTIDSSELARMALHRMDRHEVESYEAGESDTFDDPDGGLLRYSRALRGVLEVCDAWQEFPWESGCPAVDRIRQAIAYEMGIVQAPPPEVRRG